MTRQQFIDEINTWDELICWCNDHGCYYCEDIYSDQSRDDRIDEALEDWASSNSWYDLRDILNGLETGYDYWRRDDWGDWYGVDNDFDAYFSDVLSWADENGEFDDEEQQTLPPTDEPDEFEPDTSVSLDNFFISSKEHFDNIISKSEAAEAKSDAEFNKFIQRVSTVGDYSEGRYA